MREGQDLANEVAAAASASREVGFVPDVMYGTASPKDLPEMAGATYWAPVKRYLPPMYTRGMEPSCVVYGTTCHFVIRGFCSDVGCCRVG